VIALKHIARTLALGAALVAFDHAPAQAASKIQRVVSPSGIEAWLVQDATVPLVAMQFAFRGGSAQDPADKPGVAQLMADNLDEGAGDLDSSAYHERLERHAIQMNFTVTRDYIRGSLRMLKDNRDEAFDLLRLALTAPRFDAEPLERVRAQTMSILRRESVTPGSIASKKFFAAGFPNHPYAHSPRGTLASIPTIDADDLRAYRKKVFAKDGLTVAVVGDIDADALGKLLDATFGTLPAKSDLAPVPAVTLATSENRIFVPLDVPQTNILFGGPSIKRDDPDFMAAYIVNHIIGGGSLSSRLYHEVREKRGLVYSISTSLWWMDKTSIFLGSTASRADKANETLNRISIELKRIANEGPTQQELDEAKSYLKGSQMVALDSSTKFAGALLQYQLDKLGIDYLDRRPAIIDAVTLDDAKRVARKIWSHQMLAVSVGRPPAEAATPKPIKN